MANLALQMRLGIRRGWRVKMFNDSGLYTPSLLHCMFAFVLLRVKALRLNVWVVGYYMLFVLNKLIIYAFFWRLPNFNVYSLFAGSNKAYIRARLATKKVYLNGASRIRLSVLPSLRSWIKTRRLDALAESRSKGSNQSFSKIWDAGGSLLRFFSVRSRFSFGGFVGASSEAVFPLIGRQLSGSTRV